LTAPGNGRIGQRPAFRHSVESAAEAGRLLGFVPVASAQLRARERGGGLLGRVKAALLRPAAASAHCRERALEVRDQVARVFDPDREPQQVGRRGRAQTLDRGAMLQEALHPAKRGRALPEANVGGRREGRAPAAWASRVSGLSPIMLVLLCGRADQRA
jgi:hypothetical protein